MVSWRARWLSVSGRGIQVRSGVAGWCTIINWVLISFVLALGSWVLVGMVLSVVILILVVIVTPVGVLIPVGGLAFMLVLLVLLVLLLVLVLLVFFLVFILFLRFSALAEIQLLEHLVYFRCTFESWDLGNEAKSRGASR